MEPPATDTKPAVVEQQKDAESDRVQRVKAELEEEKARTRQLEEEMASLKAKIKQRQNLAKNVLSNVDELNRSAQLHAQEVKDDKASHKSFNASLQHAGDESDQVANLKAQIASNESSIAALNTRVATRTAENEGLRSALESIRQKIASHQTEHMTPEKEKCL